ncbi:MAG: hypothetical protein ACP5QT_06935 [Brevinematia bacterium]
MKKLIYFILLLFLSCNTSKYQEEKKDFENRLKNLERKGSIQSTGIEEINGIKVQNNTFLILEKSELSNNQNEQYIIINGWVIDNSMKKSFSAVYIEINNKLFMAKYGLERSGNSSGFECVIPFSDVGLFPRYLSIIAIGADKKSYYKNENIFMLSIVEKKIKSFGELKILSNKTDSTLDSINGIPVYAITNNLSFKLNDTKFLLFSGWAVDSPSYDLAGDVYIAFDKTNIFQALYGLKRVDVAEYFNTAQYMYSGFDCKIPVEKIGKGNHNLELYIINNSFTGYYVVKYNFMIELN